MPSILNGKSRPSKESPPTRERSGFNSTKLQYAFDSNDMDELKSPSNNKTRPSFKNIFATNNKYFKFNKKRRKGAKRPPKLHKTSLSAPNLSTITNKILWRPSLEIIHIDQLLLKTLIKFMEKSYNSENILFLLSVKKLQQSINHTLNHISSIYNTYIMANATHQINLSYQCFVNIISKRNTFNTFDIETQHSMFDECVTEIKHLIITSILPSFYRSSMFQSIARQSKYYEQVSKVYTYDVTKILKSDSEMEENNNDFVTYDMDGFIEPILVRNKRPSLSCELYNSTTELLIDLDVDECME